MRSVKQLYDLQLLDWEIQRSEEELSEVRAILADDSRRTQARLQLSDLEAKIRELVPSRRASDDAIRQFEQRISAIDGRLYSGIVTNPRELEAYQEERAMLVRNQRAEEDRLLEFMVEIEDTEELRNGASTTFGRIDEERQQELRTLGVRHEELSSDLPGLQASRQALVSEYPANVMAMYETVRRSRGGQGAARIDQRGMCEGCRLRIPNAEVSRARSGETVVQCGSCSRILIYG